jgi:glycosyltransferase involved in cell wall biosynthesis
MLETLLDLHNEYYLAEDKANFWQNIEDPECAAIFKHDIDRRMERYVATQASIEARLEELKQREGEALKQKSPKKIRVSGAMIVKNEEAVVKNALLSAYDVCDEICVLDTGSTDKTPEIISKFPKVKLKKKNLVPFDFSIARNMNFNMCSGDIIFVIDADELLMGESSLWKEMGSDSIYFAELTEFKNKKSVFRSTQPRVYPRNSIVWKNQVHNRPELQDASIGLFCSRNSIPLYHFKDYNKKKIEHRHERSADFVEGMKKDPDSFKKFYLMTKLYMANGDYKSAMKSGAKALKRFKLLDWNMMQMFQDFLLIYTRALFAGTRFTNAIEPLHLHANLKGLTTDGAFFNYAYASSQGEHFLAAQFLEQYFDIMDEECGKPYFMHETLEYFDQALLMRDVYRFWIKNLRIT